MVKTLAKNHTANKCSRVETPSSPDPQSEMPPTERAVMPEMPVGAGQAKYRAAAGTLALRPEADSKQSGGYLSPWAPGLRLSHEAALLALPVGWTNILSFSTSLTLPRILLKSHQSHPRQLQAYFI